MPHRGAGVPRDAYAGRAVNAVDGPAGCWHLDGHRLHGAVDGAFGDVDWTVDCDTLYRRPTAADPCRVHYAEDGTATGKVLDYCEFSAWLSASGDVFTCVDRRVVAWKITSSPIPIAVRWTGGSYVWAPSGWVLARTAGLR
jgi:hypothetical protein